MGCKIPWKICVIILSLISILLLLFVVKLVYDKATQDSANAEATQFIGNIETLLESEFQRLNVEKWNIQIGNVTFEEGSGKISSVDLREEKIRENYENILKELKVNVSERGYPWLHFNNSSLLARKIRVIGNLPTFLLDESKTKSLTDIIQNITRVQEEENWKTNENSKSTKPAYPPPKYAIYCKSNILSQSEWALHTNTVGLHVKPQFSTFVKLMNEEALLNKFTDATNYWITSTYETSDTEFNTILQRIWNQLKPLYKEFHAHLRGEIRFRWEGENIPKDGPIPAHFLQRLHFEDDGICSVVYEASRPYPTKYDLNITSELKRRRYLPSSMSTFADDFLSSVGFSLMSPSFWSESIFRKPQHVVNFNCYPQLIRFDKKDDIRLSLCGETDERTLRIMNRFMVQGSLDSLLVNQSFLLRHFANPHVRESMEEALLLAMSNQAYFRRMGVLEDYEADPPSVLNILYRELYDIIFVLTRSLVFHQWGWDVYRNKIKPTDYNSYFWKLRMKYEGVSRIGFGIFDPGVYPNLIQTPAQNIKPLIVSVMKYEIYRSLCILAEGDTTTPPRRLEPPLTPTENMGNATSSEKETTKINLFKCDLFGQTVTADRLLVLAKATSVSSWPKILEMLDLGLNPDDSTLDASAMLDYFQPLLEHLQEINKRRELPVGW